MKTITCIILMFSSLDALGQLTPSIKLPTVLVDWDKKEFKNEIPVGTDFLLKVYVKTAIHGDLVLVRFLDTHYTFYYKRIMLAKIGSVETDVSINEPVKITRKQLIKPAVAGSPPTGTIEESKEYTDDPDAIYPFVYTYLVKQVEANFSYALVSVNSYDAGVKNKMKDIILSLDGNKNPINPITNTETERVNEKFTLPIVGMAYHPDQQFVVPYAGIRIAPFRSAEQKVAG